MHQLFEISVLFAFLTWGLAFLAADAKIFGLGTQEYMEALHENAAGAESLRVNYGAFRIRNFFLKWHFFQSLLSCYFCLGVWCGPLAHILLYFSGAVLIAHHLTVIGWTTGLLISAGVGGTCCYLINLAVGILERA